MTQAAALAIAADLAAYEAAQLRAKLRNIIADLHALNYNTHTPMTSINTIMTASRSAALTYPTFIALYAMSNKSPAWERVPASSVKVGDLVADPATPSVAYYIHDSEGAAVRCVKIHQTRDARGRSSVTESVTRCTIAELYALGELLRYDTNRKPLN